MANQARCSAMLILTGSWQNVLGCSLNVPNAGTYLVTATFDMHANADGSTGDDNYYLIGGLSVQSGVPVPGNALFLTNATGGPGGGQSRATVKQQWMLGLNANDNIKLQAYKSGGSGQSRVRETHTELSWVQV